MKKQITIIGAGLSGLYAAYMLEKLGFTDYVILEAQNNIGGRIVDYAIDDKDTTNVFDLGPSWFWPELQPQLTDLLSELGIEHYPQFEQGDMLIERELNQKAVRLPNYQSEPESRRIHGGMGRIVHGLAKRLRTSNPILFGHAVNKISLDAETKQLEIECQPQPNTAPFSLHTDYVLIAMPPRLAAQSIQFEPALPKGIAQEWLATSTWMAPHAKYFAIFEQPFWREQNLSGDGRSAIGPLVEIRDASIPNGKAALLGFFGVPGHIRKQYSAEQLTEACREQLVRLFGPNARAKLDVVKDWTQEKWTSIELDEQDSGEHVRPPNAFVNNSPWAERLIGIGSEWSQRFPGYLAGAVDAADVGVKAVKTLILSDD